MRRCWTQCFVGFLDDKDQHKTAYGILAVVWGTIAAAKLFATRQFFDYVFGHAVTNPHVGFLGLQRLAGFSTLAPAVAAYTLAVRLSCTVWRHRLLLWVFILLCSRYLNLSPVFSRGYDTHNLCHHHMQTSAAHGTAGKHLSLLLTSNIVKASHCSL